MKGRVQGAGPLRVRKATLIDFTKYRCERSHDRAVDHLACRLDLVRAGAREPVRRCLESTGVFLELLLHPPAGRPIVTDVPPERLDKRHFLRLYALLATRQLATLHIDLLGELSASGSELQDALRRLFGSHAPPEGDVLDALEELLGTHLAPAVRARIQATLNHLYASALTALSN